MALINKFFSSRKKAYIKHQDVSERTFTFTKDQVRLVLFRECDFRGRKLLFDSQSVQKIPITQPNNNKTTTTTTSANSPNKPEIYVETSNGFGYQYSRPNSDIIQLGEIVFGTVAMSFRGTSLKIHSFNNPAKLMCTQVFPSPKHPLRGRISVASQQFDTLRSNNSIQSLEKSGKFDCSTNSSTTSFNEQISLNSSVPLDVPNLNQSVKLPSLEGDSGFCGEQSYSSVSSGPPSMSLWDTRHDNASVHGFSCGSLYKRWLRSASTSLDYNGYSDSSISTGVHSTASADECLTRGHRSSKLGLAVIISLSEGQEIDLERFLLEHSALIEAMVCRARSGTETAYTKPSSFASLMYKVYKETSQYLVDLTTGPTLTTYLWHILSQRNKKEFCDNNLKKSDITKTKSESSLLKTPQNRTKDNLLFSGSLLEIDNRRKFFLNVKNSAAARSVCFVNDSEKFVQELCELLEYCDTKHTNFFISTLMTAVLTHHLGWVSTVLPPSQMDKDTLSKYSPCNPLWGQLSDLYGAVGSPTKVARTIICGTTNSDIITKILYTLTYFIRCSLVERNTLTRFSAEEENREADYMCQKSKREFVGGLGRTKTCLNELKLLDNKNEHIQHENKQSEVIFVLGDDDELINIKNKNNNDQKETDLMTDSLLNIPGCSNERPKHLNIPLFSCDSSDTSPDVTSPNCCSSSSETSPKIHITHSSIINLEPTPDNFDKSEKINFDKEKIDSKRREEFNRSQSVPPSDKRKCAKNCKKKYSGVKFDFKQYPQIYKNYMKSKNLESSLDKNRSFSVSLYDCSIKYDSPSCDCVPHSEETLQTPSNATELEFTSEIPKKTKKSEVNAIYEHDIDTYEVSHIASQENKMCFVELPMPKILTKLSPHKIVGYTKTLLRGLSDRYISDVVLQGTSSPPKNWEHILRRDLQLSARKPLLDQPVQESIGIIANIDTWEVQLISSQKYFDNRVGMSQLIANMLETLLHMWKLKIPPEYCLLHIESRLREFCLRSKALATLLLNTEFCNMNFLTSTQQLEVNDVPLLMAVASTHSPQVTQKYGLSFQ